MEQPHLCFAPLRSCWGAGCHLLWPGLAEALGGGLWGRFAEIPEGTGSGERAGGAEELTGPGGRQAPPARTYLQASLQVC